MRLDSIQPADRAGRCKLLFSDGSTQRVYPQLIADLGLYSGMELDEGQMAQLRSQAGALNAKMRAVRIVSATAVSQRDLEQRLRRKGQTPEEAREATQWMADLGFLDDGETARQIVRRGVARGYGANRIRQMLYEKQIPKDLWDQALELVPDPEEDIMTYLQRHMPPDADPALRRKTVAALQRRGFSWEDIRRCLNRYCSGSGEDWEE